jgi:flagellar biosynthesis protein FlhF
MRLKSFQAKSMADAMRQVKAALGDEAIIVSTRESPGGLIRITAAVEQENPLPEKIAPKKTAAPAFTEDEIVDAVTDTLLKHRVPAIVADRLIAAASMAPGEDPRSTLASALAEVFPFRDLHGKKQKPLVLVGPPGAGKTLMTAKLAAEAVLGGTRPAVITTDIARAGGIEQLQAFLDILALPLHQAEDAKTLKAVLGGIHGTGQIIIDTGGLNPFDPQEMKALSRLLSACDADPVLVLPAGTDAEESAEMAQTFAILGVRKILPTRLDFARRLGGILSAAEKADLAFTAGSHTPQVANGIIKIDAEKLASLLLPHVPQPDKKRGKP